MFQKVDRNYP